MPGGQKNGRGRPFVLSPIAGIGNFRARMSGQRPHRQSSERVIAPSSQTMDHTRRSLVEARAIVTDALSPAP
jgi:hypothetical protein